MTDEELEDLRQWRAAPVAQLVRDKYARRLETFRQEVLELASRQGPLDDLIHARAAGAKEIAGFLRDLTEGDL